MIMKTYLERSHISYSGRSILEIYIVVAIITLVAVVGMSLVNEPTVGIVNEIPFATDIPGLDRSATADATEWKVRSRSVQSIRFARLIPVPDQTETEGKELSYEREVQHGFTIPDSYSPIFSDKDLMRKLARPLCEIIFYTITGEV